MAASAGRCERRQAVIIREMSTPYTITNLEQVDDSAVKFGFAEIGEARFANDDLAAEHTGLSHHRLKPDRRQAFGHRHDEAEEVYVVLAGSGRVKLDDQIAEVAALDAIRVAPGVTRCFEAGSEGLELLAFGAQHPGDGEIIPGWWSD